MPPVVKPLAATDRYTLHMAREQSLLLAAQRLRFEVFNLEMGEGLATSVEAGLDVDVFDAVCQHLLVVETSSGVVVGTYRMQTGNNAAAHLGYYGAREFNFKPFEASRGEIVELGRACVAVAHRNQSVLGLLWKGIARYAQSQRARYLIGCSSLTSQDQAQGLATYAKLVECALAPPEWRTMPVEGWRCQSDGVAVNAVPVPRLMSAYLAAGAKICGEPAIDREFGSIDFLTWMDLSAMPERVLRKFMG